jgi:hypothetical protein
MANSVVQSRDAGMTTMLIGCVGAALAIVAQRGVWRFRLAS